jgi:hypothetical protein
MTPFCASLTAAIGALLIGAGGPRAHGQSKHPELGPSAMSPGGRDWTVVTMAPGGSLGVATAATAGEAIAQAIRNCRGMFREGRGCGAQSRAVRTGWILAMRCGARNIIAAEASLSDAERAAADREAELRHVYVPDLPPCRRLLTVDPQGGIGITGS